MLEGCFYQHLPSLLPEISCNADCDDFRRLEHLAVCKISKFIQNHHFARWILPQLPLRLMVPLFKITLTDHFYLGQHGTIVTQERSWQAVIQLVLHWPSETFVLHEVMPPLSPTDKYELRRLETDTIDNIKTSFEMFYRTLVQRLSKELFRNKEKIGVASEIIYGPLKDIDSSGYYVPGSYDWRQGKLSPPFTQCRLSYSNSHSRAFHNILTATNHIKNLKMSGFNDPEPNIKEITDHLLLNNTQFLEVCWHGIEDYILTSICENLPHLRGLRLQQKDLYNITSITDLTSLDHLKQLDLSGINLRGKLGPLSKFTKGFDYLRLRDARLESGDLDVLTQSAHPHTLRQLDLSCNEFSHQDDAASLTALCQKLKKIQVLELEYCELHMWPERTIVNLVNFLRVLPCLTLLIMNNNMFFSQVLVMNIANLGTNKSLRYISLTIPDDLSYDQKVNKTFRAVLYEALNLYRENILYLGLKKRDYEW